MLSLRLSQIKEACPGQRAWLLLPVIVACRAPGWKSARRVGWLYIESARVSAKPLVGNQNLDSIKSTANTRIHLRGILRVAYGGTMGKSPSAARQQGRRQLPANCGRMVSSIALPKPAIRDQDCWRTCTTDGNCNDSAVRCKHSARLILEETQHGPIHRRMPVRQRPNCGVGTPIPGRPLSLSRLPQASWGPFHASAVFLQDAVMIDGETRDYAGRFFCPRCGSSIFGRSADEIEVNLGSLDAPDQLMPTYESWIVRRVLVAAVSAHETIRPRS